MRFQLAGTSARVLISFSMRIAKGLVLAALLSLSGYRVAWSQEVLGLDRSSYSSAAYYSYSDPGDVTMHVNVWGTVRNPGLYEVPQGTRLSELFSLAGGPAINERRRNDERSIHVQVTRLEEASGTSREIIFDETISGEMDPFASDPILQAGDIVSVDTVVKTPVSWRDVITMGSSLGVLALQIISLTR